MSPAAHSRAYKMAKWQLARRPWKYSVPFSLGFSLYWLGMALLDGSTLNRMMSLAIGVTWLWGAYLEWALKGYREIIEEQAKLLEETPSKQCA